MNQKLVKVGKSIRVGLTKHSPAILTGLGIAGMITSVVMAVRATPKAMLLLEDKEVELEVDKLTPVETVKTAWRCYIPTAATIALSATCLIGASSVSAKRNAALATAYTLSESALKEYQAKVVETIGEKKEQAVRDSISQDRVTKNPVTTKEVIITGKGETLCYDSISGRYFQSDIEKLKRVENQLNKQMFSDMYISLNDFYYEIGLDGTKVGDDIGWNVNNGLIDLRFSSTISDDGRPCLVIEYSVEPKYEYQNI